MSNLILESTKEHLGILSSDTVFDRQIADSINNSMAVMNQIGLDQTPLETNQNGEVLDRPWSDLSIDDEVIGFARDKIFSFVKLEFDPPASSFVNTAIENRQKEMDWRLFISTD